ncbi:MAG: hypothetical protein CMJ48_11210 [Planctomycetaceae bacterium]|nr:hypothetical protein [Planctomycetaceae bacterium]
MNDVIQQLDAVASSVIEADFSDVTDSQDVRAQLTVLEELLRAAAEEELASVARAGGMLLQVHTPADSPECAKTIEIVSLAIDRIHDAVHYESELDWAALPEQIRDQFDHVELNESTSEDAPSETEELDAELLNVFAEELSGHIDEAEQAILQLEADDEDSDALDSLFRCYHTIKGSASFVGIDLLVEVTHEIESLLDELRAQRQAVSASLIDVLLQSSDWLRGELQILQDRCEGLDVSDERADARANTVLQAVRNVARVGATPADDEPHEPNESDQTPMPTENVATIAEDDADAATAMESVPIEEAPAEPQADEQDNLALFAQDPEMLAGFVSEAQEHLDDAEPHLLSLESNPDDAEAVDAVFRSFHTIKGVAGFLELHDIQTLAHEAENLLDQVRDGKMTLSGTPMDLALDSLDALKRQVDALREVIATGEPSGTDPLSRSTSKFPGETPNSTNRSSIRLPTRWSTSSATRSITESRVPPRNASLPESPNAGKSRCGLFTEAATSTSNCKTTVPDWTAKN